MKVENGYKRDAERDTFVDGYEVRGWVGRHGRHGRIAGRQEPESSPEIGGSELLNFDELANGHREGHGKHEEAESHHRHQMYRVAPEDSLKAAEFSSGVTEGFKASGRATPWQDTSKSVRFPCTPEGAVSASRRCDTTDRGAGAWPGNNLLRDPNGSERS